METLDRFVLFLHTDTHTLVVQCEDWGLNGIVHPESSIITSNSRRETPQCGHSYTMEVNGDQNGWAAIDLLNTPVSHVRHKRHGSGGLGRVKEDDLLMWVNWLSRTNLVCNCVLVTSAGHIDPPVRMNTRLGLLRSLTNDMHVLT